MVERFNLGLGAHEMGEQAAILGPSIAELYQGRALVPAYELAAHDELGAVAVEESFLVEHIECVLGVVEDDNALS